MRRTPRCLALLARCAAVAAASLAGCGYRPLPALARHTPRIYLAAVDASRTAEPRLAAALHRALSRELARRGVALAAVARDLPALETTAHRLTSPDVALSGRQLAAAELSVDIELRLHRDGKTLWRSGLVTAREIWSIADDPLDAEQTRLITLRRLADRAAAVAIERLEQREQP